MQELSLLHFYTVILIKHSQSCWYDYLFIYLFFVCSFCTLNQTHDLGSVALKNSGTAVYVVTPDQNY